MPLEAPALAVGDLVAGERGEQAGGGPPVAVGAVGEASPRCPHGRQAQLLEQQVELGRVHDEAVAEEGALGQLSGVKQHVDLGGEPGFAALLMGQGEQIHRRQGLTAAEGFEQRVKGAAVGVAAPQILGWEHGKDYGNDPRATTDGTHTVTRSRAT